MEEETVSLESLKQEGTLWLLLSNQLGEWHTQTYKTTQIQSCSFYLLLPSRCQCCHPLTWRSSLGMGNNHGNSSHQLEHRSLVKLTAGLQPHRFWCMCLKGILKTCILNRVPGNIDAVGPETHTLKITSLDQGFSNFSVHAKTPEDVVKGQIC